MIDFFFAFVLGQGVLRFAQTVKAPWHASIPAVLALTTILYVVVRSFVGWHTAIEERRYRLFVSNVRTTELWRVYIDIGIVVVYAYLLNNAAELQRYPGQDLTAFLWGFPLLFALYCAWGHLRRVAWGTDAFKLRTLAVFGCAYTLLAAIYSVPINPPFSQSVANALALGTAFVLMATYRRINFWQGAADGPPTVLGIPRPRLPSFRVASDPVRMRLAATQRESTP